MKYWILKSETSTYSVEDLAKNKTTIWNGVRNFQARNFIRDEIRKGDLAFFYHSSTDEPSIVGLARIVSDPFPDEDALSKQSDYYDEKSSRDNPRWFAMTVKFSKKYPKPLSLNDMKKDKKLNGMKLLQKGSRLSVLPVADSEAKHILELLSK